MDSALLVHRFTSPSRSPFTIFFPQLTMGLAPLIVVLKTLALRTQGQTYNNAARFWARIFGINFVIGRRDRHPDGISVRHQLVAFFALRRWRHWPYTGHGRDVRIFPGIRLSGFVSLWRETPQPAGHWWSAVAVFLGSWLSGFFIIATDAWMQHPVGYAKAADGSLNSSAFGRLY